MDEPQSASLLFEQDIMKRMTRLLDSILNQNVIEKLARVCHAVVVSATDVDLRPSSRRPGSHATWAERNRKQNQPCVGKLGKHDQHIRTSHEG